MGCRNKDGYQFYRVYIAPEIHKELKKKVIDEDKSISKVLSDLIALFVDGKIDINKLKKEGK